MLDELPITPLLPAILESLGAHPRLVIEAAPGAGKTTQVPPALLGAAWLGAGSRILMLEPRRVAARAAATFMASQRGEAVGDTVGYRIRFERRVSPRTRIEVVTEGILTRMLQDDPTLDGVGALLFDEFHERHLQADLGLALALDVHHSIRPDLRIVLMSATLDGDKLARWLDAPRLVSATRNFPVDITHTPGARDEKIGSIVRRACAHALKAQPGDVLVFLPGARAIADCMRALQGLVDASAAIPDEAPLRVLALHGEMPIEAQAEALAPDPHGARRIVLATNVAESSVTLPGTRIVIDTGLAREPRFDPNSGFSRLATVQIAQDSATQRAGRAGRVASGWCYRLWPASKRLVPERRPEIESSDLSALALELAAWGAGTLRFVTPPPAGAMSAARDLLRSLGLLDAEERITPAGKSALGIGASPRIAAMISAAAPGPQRALACDLAALLDARDRLREAGDDLAARWRALAAARNSRAAKGAWAAIDRDAAQWRRRIDERQLPSRELSAHSLGIVLARAFPDRIARARSDDPERFQLANGRQAVLSPHSNLRGEGWLVIAELDDAPGAARVLRAAPLSETDLRAAFPERFVAVERAEWNDARGAIRADRVQMFERIELSRAPLPGPDARICAAALSDAFARRGIESLPWDERTRQLRERVWCMAEWFPEEALRPTEIAEDQQTDTSDLSSMQDPALRKPRPCWPRMDDTALLASRDVWLEPALFGKTRLDALNADELGAALANLLDDAQRRRLDALAPTHLRVPSGQSRPLSYLHGAPPVLACKLQELFGLADTPRIAEGRVQVTLHLLSPGGRPLQVTQDLRGFWDRTYPEVRREMLGRYPRHPWPLDPWTAAPTHRTKPRAR